MGGTKRMSKEEKRQAVLSIYHTTKQVYTENEIIKLASKEGIAQGAYVWGWLPHVLLFLE